MDIKEKYRSKTDHILFSPAASLQVSLPSCIPQLRHWHCHLIFKPATRRSLISTAGPTSLRPTYMPASYWSWILSILPLDLYRLSPSLPSPAAMARGRPSSPTWVLQWPPSPILSKQRVITTRCTSYHVIHLLKTLTNSLHAMGTSYEPGQW